MASVPSPQPAGAEQPAMRRAAAWLARHGMRGDAPTSLLAARLAVRRRSRVFFFAVAIGAGFVAVAALQASDRSGVQTGDRGALARMLLMVAAVVVAASVRWAWRRLVRRADRRLAARLTRRVAHSAPPTWRDLLGGLLWAGVAMYAGALGLAIAAAALGRTPQDQLLAGILLLGLMVLTAITAAEVAEAVRRPALAEDPMSLAADDALRAEDARAAVTSPIPALLAVLTVAALSTEVSASLTGFCYALVGLTLVAGVWEQFVNTRPVATP